MAQNLKVLTPDEVRQMDTLQFLEAHLSILEDSHDTKSVRTSAVALLNTDTGRAYVALNPVAL